MKLFLGDTCWDKLFDLPKSVQMKVREFQRKFKENPYNPSLNFEKISSFEDSNLRTARVDLDYRAIIGVAGDDTFCLLYIDHHDEAMRWAQHKRFNWNSYTNAFQVTTITMDEAVAAAPAAHAEETLYSKYTDEQLLRIGVPEHQLALVKGIKDLDELEKAEPLLPADVFENLFYLLDEGTDINNIITEVEAGKEASGNTTINNRRSFIEITDDEELENVIREGTEKWQIFLHPSQRLLVEKDYPGSMKVTGGGGTGKTVAALHRLKKLAATSGAKGVLYTTFTKTLLKNLSGRIAALGVRTENCELVNIDKLALDLAKRFDLVPQNASVIDYCSDKDITIELWEDIASDYLSPFSAKFLETEYQDVILYNNITSLEAYYRQTRIGRAVPITRKQRAEIWNLVEKYVALKRESGRYDRAELFNIVANYLNERNIRLYKHVIADEIQDFANPELRLLRALVPEGPNDLFMVGDPYQRIYNNRRIAFSQVGINVRGKRSKRLRVNYRTTEEIKRAAVNIVNDCAFDDFDGETETLAGYVSLLHGDKPEYKMYSTRDEEITEVYAFIEECHKAGIDYQDICVACGKRDDLKPVQNVLRSKNVPYQNLSYDTPRDLNGVVLSTFANMKGLEFKVVVLSNISKATFPLLPRDFESWDAGAKKEHLMNQKALMYVAITRAMQKVLLTGNGERADI